MTSENEQEILRIMREVSVVNWAAAQRIAEAFGCNARDVVMLCTKHNIKYDREKSPDFELLDKLLDEVVGKVGEDDIGSAHTEAMDREDTAKPQKATINKSIVNYKIVSGKTQLELQREVKDSIKMGWVPLGGVSAAAFGMSPVGGNQYIQAMVKES